MSTIQITFPSDTPFCCPRCVWGSGEHSEWCSMPKIEFPYPEVKIDPGMDQGTIELHYDGQVVSRLINVGTSKPKLPFPSVLDSTMLNSFRACPQQFYLSYVQRLVPVTKNPHFTAGGAFAKGLEVARRTFWNLKLAGVSREAAESEARLNGFSALIQTYGDYEPSDKNRHKTWDRVAAAFVSYMDHYPLGSDHLQVAEWHGKRMVEFSFALQMPVKNPETGEPIIYGGRPDWIGQYQGQDLYVVDEKTTKYFTQTWASKWTLRAQLAGYAYACRAYGIPVNGVVVRGTAMKLTEIEHAECIMTLPPWRLDRWYEQTVNDITRMAKAWERGVWDWNLGDACVAYSGCEFQELCKVQNIAPWITEEAGLFRENTWNPLAKGEEDD